MGEISEDIQAGACCAVCGVYFVEEHGYAVVCKDCWADCKGDSDYQKAIYED